jgi:hypothetical protein
MPVYGIAFQHLLTLSLQVRKKNMSNKLRTLLMAAFAVMAFAAFSSAASAVTVLNPGTFTGTATGSVTLAVAGQNLICTSSRLTDTVTASGAGTISSATYSGCSATFLGAYTVTQLSSWSSTITSSAGGYALNVTVPRGTTGLARIVGSGCSFNVSGTVSSNLAGTGGALSTIAAVTFASGGLVVDNVSGCFGLINNGATGTYSGTYSFSPSVQVGP